VADGLGLWSAARENEFTDADHAALFVGGTTSWEGAVVVVMRIERDHAFTRPFAVQGITYEHEEENKK